ncbi:uncharacterized protein LOC110636073 isoform X2 [Hevea brasiliensis]|uniref:uncharacterized protein LOC110636073 isoform X2 n=1 Tax=Hevea brasiliensis TaxID=3981 RepID=UPI0025F6AFC3|nr:uncharacterized protein LOC110636073 isoform X2 [Hevea brasiliensis]
MEDAKHLRLILRDFLTLNECKELEFIHKSSSTVGYRPNVFSTTLSHLIATNCPHFIIPFVPIRERLKEKVEEFFGCEYELFVEFTGLISWSKGASIGWHSDDNRPYLKQRDFTAVCYLNTYAKDFKGGLFHFQDGEPTTLVPKAGDVAIYTADSSNVHSVDEITEGERLTLTLWFSRDSTHDEDAKLISLLSENLLCSSNNVPGSKLPMLASSNMYWFSPEPVSNQQSGFNICCARIHLLGFDIYSSQEKSCFSDIMILMEPVKLARADELFEHEFANILHLLQVIQLSQSQKENIIALKSFVLRDHQLVEMVFSCVSNRQKCQDSFDWAKFSAAISAWEDYTHKLHEELLLSLPYWRTERIIYSVPFKGS